MDKFSKIVNVIFLMVSTIGTIYFCLDSFDFQYFTIQSNLLFSILMIGIIIAQYKDISINKWILLGVTTYISVTGIVFWSILYNLFDAKINFSNIWLHGYVVVSAWILYFVYSPREKKEDIRFIKQKEILYIMIYPAVYFIISMLEGLLTGSYIYSFMDPYKMKGWDGVFFFLIIIGFLILGIIYTLRKLKNKFTSC